MAALTVLMMRSNRPASSSDLGARGGGELDGHVPQPAEADDSDVAARPRAGARVAPGRRLPTLGVP